MLLLAANQTLIRYGINLEQTPPTPPTPTEPPPPNELEQEWDNKDLGDVVEDDGMQEQLEDQVNHLKDQLVADRLAQQVASDDAATAIAESASKKKD
jgi:hypothetical protein